MEDFDAGSLPPEAIPAAIAIVYLVSDFSRAEHEHSEHAADRVRQYFPSASVVSLFLPVVALQSALSPHVANTDYAVSSFVEAVRVPQVAAPRQPEEQLPVAN
jgi:hypothetical protein